MAENKFPSGVGKKIVEALKKQNEVEIEIQPIPDMEIPVPQEDKISNEEMDIAENNNIQENIFENDDFSDFSIENNENEDFSVYKETEEVESENDFQIEDFESEFDTDFNFEGFKSTMFEEQEVFNTPKTKATIPTAKAYAMPANVTVLKKLIMQLPQGVSKQTGAQIIRQTMEALGISMSSVLKEAQQGQDSITASAKSCLNTIAEYKNHIKTLEKQVQDYKKQAVALNDLISLFVLTDKN